MPSTSRTKIGPNHGTPHSKIWIEGRKLSEAGFTVGSRYDRTEYCNAIVIIKQPDGKGKYRVSGKGDKPIIDISGAIVARKFPAPATHVSVSITKDNIVIRQAAAQ